MSLERCEYRPAQTDAERESYVRSLCLAFASKPDDVREWLSKAGPDRVRLLVPPAGEPSEDKFSGGGGEPLAGLLVMHAGMFFGGRNVPMWGVAGVAVPPEARNRGAAREIMRRCILEAHERGIPLSALYPATQTLYRSAGYEQAGILPEIKVNPKLIRVAGDGGAKGQDIIARAITDADLPHARALYARVSRDADGRVDRGEYIWRRVKEPRDATASGFVFVAPPGGAGGEGAGDPGEPGAALEGYLYLSQKRNETGKHDATLTDVVFSTPRAGRRILQFLADLRSMCDSITWRAGPGDPLLLLMQEHPYQMRVREFWMLRVVDVARALEARGYAPGLAATLRLGVRDSVVASNTGAWRVTVADGAAHVERLDERAAGARPGAGSGTGGAHDGSIAVTERGLAALYSGFASAHALRDAGLLVADDRSCDVASALFTSFRARGGAAPSMPDFF